MTQEQKIREYMESIQYLYEKEGRPISYIARVLLVDEEELYKSIEEWGLIKADHKHLKPSHLKFLKKNRKKIIDMLASDRTIKDISKTLNINEKNLRENYIKKDKELIHHYKMLKERKKKKADERMKGMIKKSSRNYNYPLIEDEEWRDILGYDGYQVSDKGRVRKKVKKYDRYYLLKLNKNVLSGRTCVRLSSDKKMATLSVSRLVAFAFIDGHNEEKNTVDHIDGDVNNNCVENLEWVSQSENNKRSYLKGKKCVIPYGRHGRFKKVVLDDKYEFSTLTSLSKFMGVSEAQVQRYLNKENKTDRTIELIY